jgi:hypothetical protein
MSAMTPNSPVERTAGSRSLAAAAHRSRVLTVGNGDRALVVKYRGAVGDVSRVLANARDLAPVFQPEVVRQKCQGLVMTAVEDTFRLGSFSRSKTYAVVLMLTPDGSWTEIPPK